MKKIALITGILFGSFQANAQALNEVEWNVFNTIVQQSVEIGYEHFVDRDQSVGVDLFLNDRFSYATESNKDSKYKKFNTSSIGVNYSFYFGGKTNQHASGLYVQPFLKYRFGDYVEYNDVIQEREVTEMNSLILGVGAGYKFVKNDAFTFTPFINIGRNFNQDVADEFIAVEVNAGLNVGYRF